jgi:cyclin L
MALASPSMSIRDGVSSDVERVQLAYGADLISDCGVLLRLPRVAIVSAQVLFHRFYAVASLKAHSHIWIAAASLLVASKAEEHPRRIRHIANVVFHCFCSREGLGAVEAGDAAKLLPLDYYGTSGYDWKCGIVIAERHLLKELGFRVLVEHAHKFVLVFVNTLRDKAGCVDWGDEGLDYGRGTCNGDRSSPAMWRRVLQGSWDFANDAHRAQGPAALHRPEVVACACIGLAAREANLQLPDRWQEVFGGVDIGSRLEDAIRAASAEPQTAGRFLDVARSEVAKLCGPRVSMRAMSSVVAIEK